MTEKIIIPKYEVYVFDLDGTLYDQPRLRIRMATRLLQYYLLHPFKLSELLMLQRFRSVKDKWNSDSSVQPKQDNNGLDEVDADVCRYISEKSGKDYKMLSAVIKRWIYDDPLTVLYDERDKKLIEDIDRLKAAGKKIVIFSDYPVKEKLAAIGLEVDAFYSSTDKEIGELKPSPKGIDIIISDFNVEKSKIVMIGDRMEKDGRAAENAGIDYVILPRKIKDRNIDFEID